MDAGITRLAAHLGFVDQAHRWWANWNFGLTPTPPPPNFLGVRAQGPGSVRGWSPEHWPGYGAGVAEDFTGAFDRIKSYGSLVTLYKVYVDLCWLLLKTPKVEEEMTKQVGNIQPLAINPDLRWA